MPQKKMKNTYYIIMHATGATFTLEMQVGQTRSRINSINFYSKMRVRKFTPIICTGPTWYPSGVNLHLSHVLKFNLKVLRCKCTQYLIHPLSIKFFLPNSHSTKVMAMSNSSTNYYIQSHRCKWFIYISSTVTTIYQQSPPFTVNQPPPSICKWATKPE